MAALPRLRTSVSSIVLRPERPSFLGFPTTQKRWRYFPFTDEDTKV
jgi:hypothetical protein